MALFELEPRVEAKLRDSKLLKNLNKKKSSSNRKKSSSAILDIIYTIREDVEQNLGEYKDKYQIIMKEQDLDEYINKANEIGYLSIDTETTGLNPLVCKIAGLCFYSPGLKPAYIPINHEDYITGERYDEQITEQIVKPYLEKIKAKIIMFNAVFDIRVIRNAIGVNLTCYWDCLVAAKLMNENETRNTLKILHERHVSSRDKASKSFGDFFGNIIFTRVPIDCAYLYAANDALITFELFEFQNAVLNPEVRKILGKEERQDLTDIYNLLMNIEMPVVDVICDMEDTGIDVDLDYIVNYLSPKYHKIADEKMKICYDEIEKYRNQIEDYKRRKPNNKLQEPINLDSPTQLSILLYEIMRLESPDKLKPRGTGEDILIRLNLPFTDALLDYRGAQKLLRTYIDKMPETILEDGRVHCKFNALGAKTGRFSSSDPNMQNIPSKNSEIRKMFIGGIETREVESQDNIYVFDKCEEVQLSNKDWVFVELLKPGDKLQNNLTVINVKFDSNLTDKVFIRVKND